MKKFLIGFLLVFFGGMSGFIALAAIQGNWMTSVINSGTYSGSLGFWDPDAGNNKNMEPKMILSENGLIINGDFILKNGTQWEWKVLASNKDGKWYWQQNVSVMPTIMATLWEGIDIDSTWNMQSQRYTGTYITLPSNSMYAIYVNMVIGNINPGNGSWWIWIRTRLSDNNSCQDFTTDTIGNNSLVSGNITSEDRTYNMMHWTILINNKSSTPKTYYYCINSIDRWGNLNEKIYKFGGVWYAENQMYAVPFNKQQ